MYKIVPMDTADVPQAMALWRGRFDRYCKNDSFPDFWDGGDMTLRRYLSQRIEEGKAIVAKEGEDMVGYMAWMCFDFHNERTAFLPIVGSAAADGNQNVIFHELYSEASRRWVEDDRFNHLWMIFYDDAGLKDMLYDKGFGSYVADACRNTRPLASAPASIYKITQATEAAADALLTLANESERNLSEPPTFLVRKPWEKGDIVRLINDRQVFIAWDNGRAVGLLSINLDRKHDFEMLTGADSAYIGGVGAYVRPEYRRRNIGSQLLRQAIEHCRQAGKSFLHVSFETANPDAMGFWPKYFRPAIRSVRRTVNKDANLTQ